MRGWEGDGETCANVDECPNVTCHVIPPAAFRLKGVDYRDMAMVPGKSQHAQQSAVSRCMLDQLSTL